MAFRKEKEPAKLNREKMPRFFLDKTATQIKSEVNNHMLCSLINEQMSSQQKDLQSSKHLQLKKTLSGNGLNSRSRVA